MIDTALAREILAKTEAKGVAIPLNIAPGSFIQFAADKNDINEETLDGKQTCDNTCCVPKRTIWYSTSTACICRPFTTKKQKRDFCCMQNFTRIVVQSPDTDVLVLCCPQFSSLGCDELWFHTDTRDKTRYIPVHSISVSKGSSLC